MGDLAGIGEAQLGVLLVQLFLDPAVFLEHEAVIVRTDQEHVVYVPEHEVGERQPGMVEEIQSYFLLANQRASEAAISRIVMIPDVRR